MITQAIIGEFVKKVGESGTIEILTDGWQVHVCCVLDIEQITEEGIAFAERLDDDEAIQVSTEVFALYSEMIGVQIWDKNDPIIIVESANEIIHPI